MINIQEIDGKLFKIVEKKVDQFTTQRTAIPVSEEEFDKIEKLVEDQHSKEKMALATAKSKGTLKKKSEMDKLQPDAPPPMKEVERKEVLNKQFKIGR